MPGIRGAGLLVPRRPSGRRVRRGAHRRVLGHGGRRPSGLRRLSLILAALHRRGFRPPLDLRGAVHRHERRHPDRALVPYASRRELQTVLDRTIGDIASGRTVVDAGGRSGRGAAQRRQLSGLGRGQRPETRFIFDTGASTVVLRAENAAALGVHPGDAELLGPRFDRQRRSPRRPGHHRAPHGRPDHRAQRPGAHGPPGVLHVNLLGMTFLERLGSYEVRGNRLILRGKESRPVDQFVIPDAVGDPG